MMEKIEGRSLALGLLRPWSHSMDMAEQHSLLIEESSTGPESLARFGYPTDVERIGQSRGGPERFLSRF